MVMQKDHFDCTCGKNGVTVLNSPEVYGLVLLDHIVYPYMSAKRFDIIAVWSYEPQGSYYYRRDFGGFEWEEARVPFDTVHFHTTPDGPEDMGTLNQLFTERWNVFAADTLHWWVDPRSDSISIPAPKVAADFLNTIHKAIFG